MKLLYKSGEDYENTSHKTEKLCADYTEAATLSSWFHFHKPSGPSVHVISTSYLTHKSPLPVSKKILTKLELNFEKKSHMSEKSNNRHLNSGDVINSIGQERRGGVGGVVTSNCVALCVYYLHLSGSVSLPFPNL